MFITLVLVISSFGSVCKKAWWITYGGRSLDTAQVYPKDFSHQGGCIEMVLLLNTLREHGYLTTRRICPKEVIGLSY